MIQASLALFALIMVSGAFLVGYGGYDDSPGAQLLGVLAIIAGIAGIIRRYRRSGEHLHGRRGRR